MIANDQHTTRERMSARRDEWNRAHKVGTFVRYWDATNRAAWMIAPTVAEAFIHGNGLVVYVRGRKEPVALNNLEPLTPSVLFAITHPHHTPSAPRFRGRERAMPRGDRGDS